MPEFKLSGFAIVRTRVIASCLPSSRIPFVSSYSFSGSPMLLETRQRRISHPARHNDLSRCLGCLRLVCTCVSFFALACATFSQSALLPIHPQRTPPEPALRHRVFSLSEISANSLIAHASTMAAPAPPQVELTVSESTPIRAELDKAVLVRKVGQRIHAFVEDPVYAFDRMVIPEGSEVDGHIVQLSYRSFVGRIGSYLNADFSPHRIVDVDFDTLILPNGACIPIRASVMPDAGSLLKLQSYPGQNTLTGRAKRLVRGRWHNAVSQIRPSTIWSHLKFVANSYWPYHKQKIAAGSVFVIELRDALDFGPAIVPAAEIGSMGKIPPANTVAFARLVTPLSSATDHVGGSVEAVLTRPIFSSDKKLLFPVNTELLGIVVRAEPSRRLHRNGRLHFKLNRVQLPSTASEQIEMALQGMEVPRNSNVQLDSEGATHVASHEKSRVLSTALSAGIASLSLQEDRDNGIVDPSGHTGNRALAGGSGYKLVGLALTLAIKSQPLSQWMGFWGAGRSLYLHFIARGQDLILPKDTPMEISFGEPRVRSVSESSGAASIAERQ